MVTTSKEGLDLNRGYTYCFIIHLYMTLNLNATVKV